MGVVSRSWSWGRDGVGRKGGWIVMDIAFFSCSCFCVENGKWGFGVAVADSGQWFGGWEKDKGV